MRSYALVAMVASPFGLLLAGCAPGASADLESVLPKRTISSVEVVLAADADIDQVKSFDGVSDRERAPAFMALVKQSLQARLSTQPQGRSPTKLLIVVKGLTVATSQGSLIGSATAISGVADLVDEKSGQKIASLGNVAGVKPSASPLIVGPIVAAASAAMSADQTPMQEASEALADQVMGRLKTSANPT